ncbi:hypothetical protein Adt_03249 [Abeliophyllum distichum]|uniref:Uncharacterized protein n=1 Tax=Abeliophyllum distichum TaxID=126358 RepID=A0ABD1VYG1_9LAMI
MMMGSETKVTRNRKGDLIRWGGGDTHQSVFGEREVLSINHAPGLHEPHSPQCHEPPSKPSDLDSNVAGLFSPTNPKPTIGYTPSKSAPTAQNNLQPAIALGDAPSAAALASTCRASAGDPPVGTPPLEDQFAGSIGAQGMVPAVLPLVFTRGLIRSTLQATGLDSVILVDVPTSVNSSGFQPDMAYPHLKPMMEHTSIENPWST